MVLKQKIHKVYSLGFSILAYHNNSTNQAHLCPADKHLPFMSHMRNLDPYLASFPNAYSQTLFSPFAPKMPV